MSSSSLGPNSHIPPLQPVVNSLPTSTTSPSSSPYATPLSQDSARFPDTSPLVNGSDDSHSIAGGSRSRELSLDKPLIGRSPSPSGMGSRRTDLALPPLPQSPSEGSQGISSRPRAPEGGRSSPGPGGNTVALNNAASSPNLSPSTTPTAPSSAPRSQSSQAIGLGLGGVGSVGGPTLNVPSTKSDRRRSINPNMTFNLDAQNSTFAVEPRLSPLPPSPLRASFTDINKAAGGNVTSTSPTSPSPMTQPLSAEGFPFKSPGGTILRSTTPDSHNPPPRKSSLTDVNMASQPRTRSRSATASSSTPPVREEGAGEEALGAQSTSSTPQLVAPILPTMSFSLSDPDFALILNGIDQSPKSPAGGVISDQAPTLSSAITSSPSTVPAPNSKAEIDLDDTPPGSPMTDGAHSRSSPPVSNSQQFRSPHERETSPAKTRLSPTSYTAPTLRTRQASAESTHSISGRLGPDSSFSEVVGLVAEAKHGSKDKMEVDVKVLSGIVAEIEELKDVISGLRNKYTGAKVSLVPSEVQGYS